MNEYERIRQHIYDTLNFINAWQREHPGQFLPPLYAVLIDWVTLAHQELRRMEQEQKRERKNEAD